MKYRSLIMLLPFLFACNDPYWKTTASGLNYRVVTPGSGIPVTMGSTVKILTSSGNKEYRQLLPGIMKPYGYDELLLSGVNEGDSLQIILKGGSKIGIKIVKVYTAGDLQSLVRDPELRFIQLKNN